MDAKFSTCATPWDTGTATASVSKRPTDETAAQQSRAVLYFLSASRVPSPRHHFFYQARNQHEVSQLSQFTMSRGVIIPPLLALASSSGRVRLRKSDQPRGFYIWLRHLPGLRSSRAFPKKSLRPRPQK